MEPSFGPIFIAGVPAGIFTLALVTWVVAHPRCRHCQERVLSVSEEDGRSVVRCPNGCGGE
jgi:hypothetical protein